MVGKGGNDTEAEDEDDLDVEGELYNLMRGNTSLMIAATSDDSDDESEGNDAEEEQQESDMSVEASEIGSSSVVVPEMGAHYPRILVCITSMGFLAHQSSNMGKQSLALQQR